MTKFSAIPGHSSTLKWAEEQGLDPHEISRDFEILEDGTYVLSKYKKNAEGKKYFDPETNDVAKETFMFKPTRPLPLYHHGGED